MGQPGEGLTLQKKRMVTPIKTTPGQKNVVHPALGDKLKIHLPPLHIKIGLENYLRNLWVGHVKVLANEAKIFSK
jgi:hypothetical protein